MCVLPFGNLVERRQGDRSSEQLGQIARNRHRHRHRSIVEERELLSPWLPQDLAQSHCKTQKLSQQSACLQDCIIERETAFTGLSCCRLDN